MRKFTKSVLALALAVAPVAASAQTQGSFTLHSASINYFSGVAAGGFMATGTLSFATGTWSIFCIDDNNGISFSSNTFNVFATEILSTSNYDWTRVGANAAPGLNQTDAESFARYNRAKGFAAAINMAMGDSPANRTQQVAMWQSTDNASSTALNGAAVGAVSHSSVNGFRAFVLTGRNANNGLNLTQQELIAIQPTVVVPEPSTYALLATGLAAVAAMARRRRKA